MILRIESANQDMTRRAVIERNDSGEAPPWNVDLSDYADTVAIYSVGTLTKAQQIARGWCDRGRKA